MPIPEKLSSYSEMRLRHAGIIPGELHPIFRALLPVEQITVEILQSSSLQGTGLSNLEQRVRMPTRRPSGQPTCITKVKRC